MSKDTIYRQDAIYALDEIESEVADGYGFQYEKWRKHFTDLPSAQRDTMAVRGYPIDADYLMAKVAEEYGERARDALYRIIRYMPPARSEQRWIPVSERLPEDEYVLISKKPTKISGSKWSVAIAIRTADPRSRKIQWRDSGFGVIQDDKVLAWMSLPEPYQEGGAE